MTVQAAVTMIRATPQSRRSEFAREIWSLRRQRGTDPGEHNSDEWNRSRRNARRADTAQYRQICDRQLLHNGQIEAGELAEEKHSCSLVERSAILVRGRSHCQDKAVYRARNAEVFFAHPQRSRQGRV